MRRFCLLFLSVFFLLTACKSPPPAPKIPPLPVQENPYAILQFDHLEAKNINQFRLHYSLIITNPRTMQLETTITGWKILINGNEINSDTAVLIFEDDNVNGFTLKQRQSSEMEKNIVLSLDLEDRAVSSLFNIKDEYHAELVFFLKFNYGNSVINDKVSANTVFPRIREPQLSITSIKILQAELINTRFKVNIKIDNPNPFPVSISSMNYELYGDGRYWAGGKENDVLYISALSSHDTDLFLMMNFINMNRSLLDDIIAMRHVRYRFTGDVSVGTGLDWLPVFRTVFNLSGNSPVTR